MQINMENPQINNNNTNQTQTNRPSEIFIKDSLSTLQQRYEKLDINYFNQKDKLTYFSKNLMWVQNIYCEINDISADHYDETHLLKISCLSDCHKKIKDFYQEFKKSMDDAEEYCTREYNDVKIFNHGDHAKKSLIDNLKKYITEADTCIENYFPDNTDIKNCLKDYSFDEKNLCTKYKNTLKKLLDELKPSEEERHKNHKNKTPMAKKIYNTMFDNYLGGKIVGGILFFIVICAIIKYKYYNNTEVAPVVTQSAHTNIIINNITTKKEEVSAK